MKKLILLLLLPTSLLAQSNYVTLSSSNATLKLVTKQQFYPSGALFTVAPLTNSPVTNIYGLQYSTNITGIIQFPLNTDIIKFTNAVVTQSVLSTNSALPVVGNYRIKIYTNNMLTAYYDSGDVQVYSNYPSAGTNIVQFSYTNNFRTNLFLTVTNATSTNYIFNTNITYASIYFFLGYYTNNAIYTNWDSQWWLNGKIEFK